jgi:hypothetical protein
MQKEHLVELYMLPYISFVHWSKKKKLKGGRPDKFNYTSFENGV